MSSLIRPTVRRLEELPCSGPMEKNGIILLEKPEGISSFRALGPVKRALKTKKIGHTGTLDPFASGLMILLAGRYTKLAKLFEGLDKTYLIEAAWGERTDTLDPEGEIIETSPIPSRTDIDRVIPDFIGCQLQVPPLYSAVHVQGKRAYQRSREGEDFTIPERQVEVSELHHIRHEGNRSRMTAVCSKGTYVRSLIRDIGKAAGSCGYVSALRRTRVGPFSVDEAVTPESFSEKPVMRNLSTVLLDYPQLFPDMKPVYPRSSAVPRIREGVPPAKDFFDEDLEGGQYLLIANGRALAVMVWDGVQGRYKPLLEPKE